MEKPLVGDVVAIAQITSRSRPDQLAVAIDGSSFLQGGLPVPSLVRCGKVFTADANIVQKHLGKLSNSVLTQVVHGIQSLLGQNL